MDKQFKRLRKIEHIPSLFPDLGITKSSLLTCMFESEQNGFASCMVNINSECQIDIDAFEKWLQRRASKVEPE